MSIGSNNQIVAAGREFENIYFAFNSFELTSTAKNETAFIIAWMNNNPDSRIEITGHADEKGDAVYNQRLSEKRAVAVKEMLVSAGINPNRIVTVGKGENEPVSGYPETPLDDPGAQNRRVVIRIAE